MQRQHGGRVGGWRDRDTWCPEFEATRSERRWGERPANQEFVDNEELLEGLICVTEITLGHLKLGLAGRKEILWGQENGWKVIGVGQGLEGYVGFPSLSSLPLCWTPYPGPLVLKALWVTFLQRTYLRILPCMRCLSSCFPPVTGTCPQSSTFMTFPCDL